MSGYDQILLYIYHGISWDIIGYDMLLFYEKIWSDMIIYTLAIQYDTTWFHMFWYDTRWKIYRAIIIWYDNIIYMVVYYDIVWYDMAWYDIIWYHIIWYYMVWYDVMWYDAMRCKASISGLVHILLNDVLNFYERMALLLCIVFSVEW